MRRLIFLTLVTVSAVAFTACESTASNTNNSRNNVNNNSNSNNITVVPTNNNANANTNSNANKAVTKEEYEKNKGTYTEQAKSLGSKIGQGAEDGWIWTKTRADLLATSDLRESTVNVDVDNAVITLKGTVATDAQKKKAEEVAKAVEGQKGVKNELKVAPKDSVANLSTSSTDSDTKKTNTNMNKK